MLSNIVNLFLIILDKPLQLCLFNNLYLKSIGFLLVISLIIVYFLDPLLSNFAILLHVFLYYFLLLILLSSHFLKSITSGQ